MVMTVFPDESSFMSMNLISGMSSTGIGLAWPLAASAFLRSPIARQSLVNPDMEIRVAPPLVDSALASLQTSTFPPMLLII